MDNKTFKELIKKGELSLILMDGGADLTPQQMSKVKQTAKDLSDERLEKMAMELASSPGYQEMIMMPLFSKLISNTFGDKTSKNKPSETPSETTVSTSEKKEKVEVKKDPELSSVSPTTDTPLKSGDSSSDILTKIFHLMVKNYDENNEAFEETKKFRQKQIETKELRSDELIKLFSGKKGPTKKIKEEKPKTTEKKKEPSKKPTEETKTETPTAERAPSTAPSTSSVTKKVITAAVGTAAAVGMTSAIGGAESGGNYNITFGDSLDKKGNLVRGSNLSPEQKYGKQLTDLTLEEVDALGKERNRNSKNTSAMGKYQFMNSTLFGQKDKKGVFHPGLVQQAGLDMKTTKFTPEIQDKLYNRLHQQDVSALKQKGVPVTPGYEYMAHYLGAGGAAAVYERRNTNMTVEQALVAAGLPDPVSGKTNAELATIKASEFEGILEKRLNKQGLGSPHASGVPAVAAVPSKGVDIPNKLPKRGNSGAPAAVVQQNNNTNVYSGGTTYTITEEPAKTNAPLLDKQYQ